MMFLVLLKLSAVMISVALGAGILARDHDLVANRAIAFFFFCNAWWAGCEFYLFQATDPEVARALFRGMSLGWVPLGVLCMHGSLNLSSVADHPIARMPPFIYAAIACFLPFAIGTDWVIVDAERTSFGWRPSFGPGLLVAYLLMAAPLVVILTCWRRLMALPGRGGQNQLAGIIFGGVSAALLAGTITAIVLPLAGVTSVGATTSLVGLVGLAAAHTLHRYGYSLISPESFAREILDTLEDGVVVLGEGGIVRDVNRAFGRMVGAEPDSIIGRPITRWMPAFPMPLERCDAPTFLEIRNGAGDRLPIVVSAPVRLPGRRRAMGDAFLLRDRRELISLQRQLAVSGRLAAVGDLSKSISESIHEPAVETRRQLEALAGEWQEMLDRLEEDGRLEACREIVSEGQELIGECLEGVDRVNAIVHDVGSFSPDVPEAGFRRHALADIVDSALRIASVQARQPVEVEARLDGDVDVLCHRAELERVVTNLLVNAFQALADEARGTAHLAVAVGAQGSRALLHVEDDGCGIAPEVLDRVFDPFFTTKAVGQGTGLGLAISYHIVRKHGGEIRVSSVVDHGTSVTVELPRVRDEGNGRGADRMGRG